MKVQYLDIVTSNVEVVCAAYAAAHGAQFGELDESPGGVRTPLRETEEPMVRPYWLVEDIEAAVAALAEAAGVITVPPMEIPGRGTFAIYLQGGNDHGLWQL
ncbi:hypothetical protein [Thauera sp. Sel9]|uniref:hypothetical protein n=1 Tax=Thauera sp. Sel9 TaxID=2974299 RepID=UPI0021E13213|nr:hypothetical protein [Thauera sp. Sel9]MCV2218514.1 hypothetical protein [Thauera sp. Sel9]